MTSRNEERLPIWTGLFQAILSGAGIVAVVIYSVGWLYWAGYFGYFRVPIGAVDLGIDDIALGGFPRFGLVIVILASMPFLILLERRRPRRLSLRLRMEALLLIGSVVLAILGGMFLFSYLPEGLASAWARLPGTALELVLILTTSALAMQLWERRLNLTTMLFAFLIAVGLPGSAVLDGRLSAYAAWHSDNRTNYFEQVVLYSELPVFEEWEQQVGGLYASPELMLIRKAGGTYVVANEDEPDKVTVIRSDIITHVDYMR